MRRLRSPLIALIALALTAGAAFASRALPQAASAGLAGAASAAGHAVPVRSDEEHGQASGAQQTADQDDNDQDATENAATHPDNHGKTVSEAAHMTDAQIAALGVGTFANHGAYVSSVAKKNSGQTTSATHSAGHGKPAGAGKPDDTGKPD